MIIGVSGEGSTKAIPFLSNNSFKAINIDDLLKMYFDKFNLVNMGKFEENRRVLEIFDSINSLLLDKIYELKNDENLVLYSSILECFSAFDFCDLKINISSSNNVGNNQLDYYGKIARCKFAPSYYHLCLDVDSNTDWKNHFNNFINFNIKGKNKVSIIVPIFNTSQYLVKCIKSIMNQSYKNLEIILINDGSTDNSLELCQRLALEDDRIKVFSQENKGLSTTRNLGIGYATGDYICFIDSDDYLENDMIEVLLKNAISANADVSSIRAFVHTRDGEIRKYSNDPRSINIYDNIDKIVNAYANGNISIAMWDKMFKKTFIEKVRFSPDVYQEDADFMLRLCMNGGIFVCDTKECYHYIKHKNNSITSQLSDKIFLLREWALKSYQHIMLKFGDSHRDDAEKILFNSLSHILKMYLRDINDKKILLLDYNDKLQQVANDLMYLLLHAKNIEKFKDIDNVLSVVDRLIDLKVLDQTKMPYLDLNCIGILWNALNSNLMADAIQQIGQFAEIESCSIVDLDSKYRDFIDDIYYFNNEFEGIPYLKGCGLINMYDTNMIAILYLKIRITGIIRDRMKGYMYREVADLKHFIRNNFKKKIRNYAYDNIFHLTVDEDEYVFTDGIIKKYIGREQEEVHERK